MLTITRYKNRKLYASIDGRAGYVTVQDVYNLIQRGETIQVIDRETKEDLTTKVLAESLSTLNLTLAQLVDIIKTSGGTNEVQG